MMFLIEVNTTDGITAVEIKQAMEIVAQAHNFEFKSTVSLLEP